MSLPPLRFLYPPRLLRPTQASIPLKISVPPSRSLLQQRHGTAVDPSTTTLSPPASPTTSEPPKLPSDTLPSPQVASQHVPPNSPPPLTAIGTSLKTPHISPTPSTPPPADSPSDHSPTTPLHNIDTYSLTRTLTPSFTRPQSLILTDAISSLLTHHLSLASTHYLSRPHHSSSLYLLTTSLTSLRSEISSQRLASLSSLRSERARLQAEYDALQERYMVEVLQMHNEIRGEWEDWKGRCRMELREREGKLKELEWKIGVRLKGAVGEDVERVRWVVMRRGLVGIAMLAVVLVSGIRLNGMMRKREKAEEEEKKEKEKREVEMTFGQVQGKGNSIGEGLAGLG